MKEKNLNSILCYYLIHRIIADTKLFIAFDRKEKQKKTKQKK